MTQTADAVVRKADRRRRTDRAAFAVFTERFGDFKPPEHNLLARADRRDRCSSRGSAGTSSTAAEDGSECRWARVLAYEPPDRVVFSWDISPTWQLETDPDNASEVEVRFVAEGPERTRVELEHRHLDRHGPGWEAVRDGVDGDERLAAVPRPVRRPVRRRPLNGADHRRASRSTARRGRVRLRHRPDPVPRVADRGRRRATWTAPEAPRRGCPVRDRPPDRRAPSAARRPSWFVGPAAGLGGAWHRRTNPLTAVDVTRNGSSSPPADRAVGADPPRATGQRLDRRHSHTGPRRSRRPGARRGRQTRQRRLRRRCSRPDPPKRAGAAGLCHVGDRWRTWQETSVAIPLTFRRACRDIRRESH